MSIGYLEHLVTFIFIFMFWCHNYACKFMHVYFSFDLSRWRQSIIFPVTRLSVLNSVTDSPRHSLLLPALHSQWSRQVYIIHQCITGCLVVQEPTCMHAHEYGLLGASCYFLVSYWCMQIYACIF